MVLSDEVRAVHRNLSERDLEFREAAAQDLRFLDQTQFEPLNRHHALLHYRLQPWPTFLGQEKRAELERISAGIYSLLCTLPDRVFGKDYLRMSRFYGMDSPAMAEILFTPPTGIPTVVSRGDLIDTQHGFKCIEFNFTPSLGGWESSILVDLHLSVPATAGFLSSRGIPVAYSNTVQKFLTLIVQDVLAKGLCDDGEVNIVFTYPTSSPDELVDPNDTGAHYMNQELSQVLERQGGGLRGRVLLCRFGSLSSRGKTLVKDGLPIHAVAEFNRDSEPLAYRFFKAGRVSLFNGPINQILGDKRNFALLSELADSDLFTAQERELIHRHVPWTRLLTAGKAEFEGESVSLPDLLRTRRERFVIKGAKSFGGKAVYVGNATPEPVWREAVGKALQEGQWIVQEHLESLPYLYQSGAYGCSVHDVIWGPFIFAGEYAGVILRMQPKAAGGAVNLSLAATEGVVLEV